MTIGYPDYARLSEQGGFSIFSTKGNVNNGAFVFEGYVGSWPYLNMFTLMSASSDFGRIALVYYADEKFTNQVGFRYAIRTGNSFAITQYANLSPWLQIQFNTISTNPMSFTEWTVYGTQGYSPQTQLASTDVPIFSTNQTIAAGTTVQAFPQHIQPGSGIANVSIGTNTWYANIFAWDYGGNAWALDTQLIGSWAGNGGVFDVPMLDTPYRIDMHNSGSAAIAFNFAWKST